jgi:hypothetical protein
MSMSYFIVMIDYGRKGREAIVDPEITRREVVSRIKSGEYKTIAFIHHVDDGLVEDVTNDVLKEAGFYSDEPSPAMAKFDALIETIKREVEHV